MKLPYEPKALYNRAGDRVVVITGIGHTVKPPQNGYSNDYFYFIGHTSCPKDPKHLGHISLSEIRADTQEGFDETKALNALMADYLMERGDWCHSLSGHEGWFAHRRAKAKA